MAVKACLRECCLSSIRHITANVAIKVERYTHTHTHTHTHTLTQTCTHTALSDLERNTHTLFSWGGTWQDSSVGSLTEGGKRRRRRWRRRRRRRRRRRGRGANEGT